VRHRRRLLPFFDDFLHPAGVSVQAQEMTGNPWYRLDTFRAALRLVGMLPRDVAQEVAGAIGRAGYGFARSGREAARDNLARITGLRDVMLDELCRENFDCFLRMLSDYFYCSTAAPEEIRALVEEWVGFEHIVAARERGKGGILVTAHLGNWEMGGILLALEGVPLTVVTLEEPASGLTEWRERYRRRLGIKTIQVGADPFSFVGIFSALRRNEFVAMLVDRPYGDAAAPVSFFGAQTSFSAAPTLLWRHTGAAVIPAFVLQKPGGRYASILAPPIPMDADGAANAQRFATVFETVVRCNPEQWFNYVPIWK
jgi:lauroyl/myristoyl acyltransferase